MLWLILALISPLLYAASNHIDKFIVEKYLKGDEGDGSAGSLILFSSLVGLIVLPITFFISPNVLNISIIDASLMIFVGIISLLAIWLYLYALWDEDTSNVVPFWQTAPIFGFILAYFILGETLTFYQGVASLFIIASGAILSLDWKKDGSLKIKWRLVGIMLLSSFLFGLNDVLFKSTALDFGYITSMFWTYCGYVALGVVIFMLSKKYRTDFLRLFEHKGPTVIGLNVSTEILAVAGDSLVRLATLFAPVALVAAVSDGFQPFLVLISGLILTWLIPGITFETVNKREISKKIIAIILMGVGAVFLYMSGI